MYQSGISGNALLDLEIAHVMAGVDASVFVLDFVPNAGVEQIKERAGAFYSIIRSKHPDTPVLLWKILYLPIPVLTGP